MAAGGSCRRHGREFELQLWADIRSEKIGRGEALHSRSHRPTSVVRVLNL